MTAAEESEQIVEKLRHICRADIVLQMQFMNSFPQINPKIFFVEHTEVFSVALQQAEAIIVECRRMNRLAQQRANALAHLSRGGDRIGEGEHVLRIGVSLLDQPGNAVDQDRRFPCARARHHQHWTVNMLDRLSLLFIGGKRSGM